MWRGGGVELARGLTVRQALSCVRLAIIVVSSAITPKTRGAALFRNVRKRRTPPCTRIFEIVSYLTAVITKNDNGISVHRVHGRSDPPPVSPTPPTSTQRRHGHIDYVDRFAAIA